MEVRRKSPEEVIAHIEKEAPGVLFTADKIAKMKQPKIITGVPSLDFYLGGGLSRAKILHMYGDSQQGKSSTLAEIIAVNQHYDPQSRAAVVSLENYWSPENVPFFTDVFNMDLSRVHLCMSQSHEDAYDVAMELINSRAYDIVAFDSVAATVSQKSQDKSFGDSEKIADRASIVENFCRKATAAMQVQYDKKDKAAYPSPTLVILLNQMRTQFKKTPTGSVAFKAPASADSIKFAAEYEIFVHSEGKEDILKYEYNESIFEKVGKALDYHDYVNNEKIGKKIRYKLIKTRGSRFQDRVASVDFYNGTLGYPSPTFFTSAGFDGEFGFIEFAEYAGLLKKSGAWYQVEGTEKMVNGDKKIAIMMRTDESFRTMIFNKFQELTGIDWKRYVKAQERERKK